MNWSHWKWVKNRRTLRNDQRIKVDALNSEVSLAKIELATLNGKVSGTSPDDVATVLAQLETDMAIKRDVMEQGERSTRKTQTTEISNLKIIRMRER